MDEDEIIGRMIMGDEKSFWLFVDAYRQLVMNCCVGLLHSREDAEDVAQEVFVEVYHSIHKFRRQAKVSAWLCRIAVNRSLNFIRDNRKHRWFLSAPNVSVSEICKTEDSLCPSVEMPDAGLENSQRAMLLHHAIDLLPEKQRVAFVLSKYDDLSNLEIAEVMNLSVPAVEALLHRAKKNLQKKLYYWYKKNMI